MTDCPPAIRRRLRSKIGTRTIRRNGVKSHCRTKPRELLRRAIEAWRAAGCPEVPRRG